MRSAWVSPRSLTRSSTLLPLPTLVATTQVPKGSVLCDMVSASGWQRSPLAVRRPLNLRPYQAILPVSAAESAVLAGSAAGVAAGAEHAER